MAINVDLTALPELTNDKFYPYYEDQHRYLVLMGGGGSGKSVFAAQKIIYRTLCEVPHRFLVVRKVGKTMRESVFAELRGVIADWGLQKLFKVNKSDLRITCVNGNEILFSGLDDVEKLKSIYKVTSIWIEEASEILPGDFRQLDIRLRGKTRHYKQIIFTFNPISITHWLKEEFFDKYKPGATTLHSTYFDNRFLDEEAKRVLESFAETDEYYYQVYCLGQWGVLGKTVFDARKVSERLLEIKDREPIREGYFAYDYVDEKVIDSTITWIDEPGGPIRIYEDVQEYYPYVIGGDTAGEGSDKFTGQVINNVTGIQAATLRHELDEDLYAKQMYCLGKYYNYALIGIETNFSTYPVRELQRLGYAKQFIREVEDRITKKKRRSYGFQSNKLTRPVAIADLVKMVRDSVELFNDTQTLEEMLTFVRNEDTSKPEAEEGAHDDLVIALAIAYYVRDQQSMRVQEPQKKKNSNKPVNPFTGY